MSTCGESCVEQIVLPLRGALSSVSQSDGVEGRACSGSGNTLPCTAVPAASPSGMETSSCDAVSWETSMENWALLLWPYNGGGGAEDANNHPLEDASTWVRKFLDGGHKNEANKSGTI